MKRSLVAVYIVAGILVLFLIIGSVFIPRNSVRVASNSGSVRAVIADTEAKRIQGLSKWPKLPKDQAMLLVFDTDKRHGIWMKDMQFAIDVIWIDRQKIVVDVIPNMKPSSYPTTYYSRTDARYILEVSAGQAKAKGFSVGTQLSYPSVID